MGVNSKAKGNAGERELCKIFSARFPTRHPFVRVVGSGNRWSQVALGDHVKNSLTGDIVAPAGFRHCIECKIGGKGISGDIFTTVVAGYRLLDEFLEQAEADAERVGLSPLLCWRQDRRPWLGFFRQPSPLWCSQTVNRYLQYGKWMAVGLTEILSWQDSLFFIEKSNDNEQ